jgi:hypothetical protein
VVLAGALMLPRVAWPPGAVPDERGQAGRQDVARPAACAATTGTQDVGGADAEQHHDQDGGDRAVGVEVQGLVDVADQPESSKPLADIYRAAAWTGSIDRPQYWWNLRQFLAEATLGSSYLAVRGTEGAEGAVHHPSRAVRRDQLLSWPSRRCAVGRFRSGLPGHELSDRNRLAARGVAR